MPKYICDLYGNSSWNVSPEEVMSRTFETELEAQEWFKQKFTNELNFSGFYLTEYDTTNWVTVRGVEVGQIIKRPLPGESLV